MGNLFDIFGNQTPIEDESEKQNNALEQQKKPLAEEQNQNSQIEVILNQDEINIQEYLQINLEAFKLTQQNLIDGFGQILMYLDFHKGPNQITPLLMKVFAGELALRYRDNIYHNFRHGFSVFQFTFVLFISSEIIINQIPRNEYLAHLIACFAHDVEHPGVNNAFLKNQQHELSIKYNQVSILENHHAAVLYHLLNNNRSNILKSYPEKDQKLLRKQIIQSILATDPARHFEVIDNFQKFKGQLDNQQKRQYFLDYMLHAADIHNPALKWELASKWAILILDEFTQQTQKEAILALPVTTFMQIGRDLQKIKDSQIGFINKYIIPVFVEIREIIPISQDLIQSLESNLEKWKQLEDIKELVDAL